MVAVENRGAVFPRSSKSSVSVRAINDEELGDGAIFHHLTGRYLFSRRFSCSSAFNRLAWSSPKPPYSFRQR